MKAIITSLKRSASSAYHDLFDYDPRLGASFAAIFGGAVGFAAGAWLLVWLLAYAFSEMPQ